MLESCDINADYVQINDMIKLLRSHRGVKAVSKKVSLTIIALVLFVALSGIDISCKSSSPAQLMKHADESQGFSIDYPKGWDVVTDVAHVNVLCNIWKNKYSSNLAGVQISKYADKKAASLRFTTSQLKEAVTSVDTFSALLMKGLPDDFADYEPISTEQLTINGIPAIKHTFTGSVFKRTAGIQYSVDYNYVQVYLVKNGVGWTLHFPCSEEDLDSYESTFDTILQSFRLLN